MYHCPVYFFGTCFQTIPFSKKKKKVLRQTTTNEWLNQQFIFKHNVLPLQKKASNTMALQKKSVQPFCT